MFSNMFVIFIPKIWGRWTQFDEHIFQMGCFNHQLDQLEANCLQHLLTALDFLHENKVRGETSRRRVNRNVETTRWNGRAALKGHENCHQQTEHLIVFFVVVVIWGENPKSAICHYVSGCKKKMVVSELLQAMNYVSNQDFKYNKFTKSLE